METLSFLAASLTLVFVQGDGLLMEPTGGASPFASVGPSFSTEPPSRVEFTNDTGALVPCSARGRPPPRVTWTLRDGSRRVPVTEAVSFSEADGTLRFSPFPGDGFRRGVHDAVYRCKAENPAGTVLSREVHVNAVVHRRYSVQVYDEFVVRGNTAVLRCQVPAFVADYVTYAWRRGDQPIVPTTGGRYSVLRSGELYIRGATPADGQRHYACETRHRLTGELVVSSSSSGNLFVTESHGPSPPKVVSYRPAMSVSEGDSLEMACAATAFPPPTYRWYREHEAGLVPVSMQEDKRQLDGSLFLQFVRLEDGGRYACVANNSAGEDRAYTLLTVNAPLSVTVDPRRQVSDVGSRATFNCSVSGHPVRSVVWLKDGQPVRTSSSVDSRQLRIAAVRREDAGMYQCLVSNDFDSAQGTAELRLGDVAPVLLSTFSGESVHPGTSVSMRCTASGNPLPQVTWFLDDSPLPSDVSPRFRVGDFVTAEGHVVSHVNVTDVRTEDGGEYSCSAVNSVSRARHSARLDVFGPPTVREMPDAVTAVAGRTLTLRCPASGYPLDTIVWKKDGSVLPTHHRQRLEGLGILVIRDVQRSADEGVYSCEARGPDSSVAEGRTTLRVLVPPTIESVLLPETLYAEEGKRTRIMCSVTQGDPPVRIEWRRDGSRLPPDLLTQNLEDSSLLVFRKTSPAHSGNYTCFASNAADTVNRTTRLIVNVPPRWIVEPTNSFAVVGQSVVMDCSAEGHPPPTVLWKKATGARELEFRDVASTSGYRRHEALVNGSLWLREVSESDAGHYLCQATNGIGAGLSKVVQLKVHTPPRFETKFVSHTVTRGRDAELRCEARGEPEIRIQWEKDKQPIDPHTLKRLSAVTEPSGEDTRTVSRLLIRGAGRSDSALYTCIASNEFGRDETNMQLVVQESPSAPVDLVVQEKTSRSVSLSWSPAFSGNSPVLSYVLEYGNASSEGEAELSSQRVSGTENVGVVRGLHPATAYRFRVSAENALGRSEPAPFVTVNTEEEVPGGPPLDVDVQPTGSQSLKVTWKAPREDLRHGTILGYYIGYRPSEDPGGAAPPFQYKNVEAASPSQPMVSYLTNLRRLTRYAVIVQAYNDVGAGPRSDEVTAVTLEAAPPTSPVLTLHSVTSSSVTVTWDRQQDDTGLRDYVLHYRSEGEDSWQERPLTTDRNLYSLGGLRCGTSYRLYMTATNSLGTGEPGDVLTIRTRGAAPLSPQRDAFLTVNATSATLHLDAWTSGGCPVLHYSVHLRRGLGGPWEAVAERLDARQTHAEVRHLVPNRDYTVRVSAHSEAGTTEAEYRFTTLNVTLSVVTVGKGGMFPPPLDGLSLPFHRNLAILLPVVISVGVLLVVVITVIVCLRRQTDAPHEGGLRRESSSKGGLQQHLSLSELPRKGSGGGGKEPSSYGLAKSSYYSSPARKPFAMTGANYREGSSPHNIKKYSGWS